LAAVFNKNLSLNSGSVNIFCENVAFCRFLSSLLDIFFATLSLFVALCRFLSLLVALCRLFSLSPNNPFSAIIQKANLKKRRKKNGNGPLFFRQVDIDWPEFQKRSLHALKLSAARVNQYPSFASNPSLFFLCFYLYPLLVIIDS
jgi:hypothetical protein